MAGLTSTGLTIKRLPEIIQDIVTKERELIDAGIITSDDTVLGQINSIFAAALSEVWALSEAVNDNFNKNKAEGKNLDDLGDIIGVYRILESFTFGNVRITARDGTLITQGTLVSSPTTGYNFSVDTTQTLSTSSCLSCTLRIATVSNSTAYTVSVDGDVYTYTSDNDSSALEIATGLQNLINADVDATWTASLDGSRLTITSDTDDNIEVVHTALIGADTVVKDVGVTCTEAGPVVAPPLTVNTLIQPNPAITSVTNPVEFIQGRLRETDEDFRKRFTISASGGKATLQAIRDAIFDVDGVSYVSVLENETFVTDIDGRPPKSFEAIVQGGTDAEVAVTVWDWKPAGIEMYGNTTEIFTDDFGQQRTVLFTRPEAVNLAVRVTYTIYDEETFPDDGQDIITEAVVAYFNSLSVNVDAIPRRAFGPIYSAVNGIDDLMVEIQEITTPGDAPVELDWQETRIPISARQFAQTTSADVYIVETP